MRFKLTLCLLLANLAIFFLLWRLNQPPEIAARPAGPIPKDNFDIDHITIDNHVQNEVRELKRDKDGVWHLVKPVDWLANDDAVTSLVFHLEFLDEKANFSIEDMKSGGESLSTYGLDKPAVEITVQSGAQTATLDIGSANKGGYLYVMNPKDGLVRVVSQDMLSTLDVPLDDLKETRLFTLNIFAVRSLSISAAGSSSAATASFTRFVKDGDDWRLDTPFSCPADYDKVKKAIGELEDLQAESFVPVADATDLTRLGLSTPFLKIELKGDSGDASQTLLLGDKVPGAPEAEFYAKLADSPTVVVVKDDEVFTTLLHAQDDLRQRQFLNFAPENVSTVSIHSADPADLQMEMLENRTWHIVDKDAVTGTPAFIPADTEIIKTMLDNLRHLSAKGFVSDAPTSDDLQNTYNLKTPQWKVVLQGDKTFKPITLDIGIRLVTATSPDAPLVRYYAKQEGADSVYEIGGEILGQLSINALHYRDRVLEELPTGAQIVSLKLTHLNDNDLEKGEEVFNGTIDPAKTSWDDFLKDKPQLIRDNVPVMLDALRKFEVETYMESKFDEHYQTDLAETSSASISTPVPWRYRLDMGVQLTGTVGAVGTTETLIFYFSDRFGSEQFGGTREAPLPPAIFTLPIKFIGALGIITKDLTQPAAALETVQGMAQPIIPAMAVPAAASSTPPANPSLEPITPLDLTVPAPAPVPAAPSIGPAP